jgi:hypothetical protein
VDIFQPERKPAGRARERVNARREKQARPPHVQPMKPAGAEAPPPVADLAQRVYTPRASRRARDRQMVESVVTASYGSAQSAPAGWRARVAARAETALHDFSWAVRRDVRIPAALASAVAACVLVYVATYVLGGRIFPNVWVLGLDVGGNTVEEAAARLQTHWDTTLRIRLVDDGTNGEGEIATAAAREWAMTPAELGLSLDAQATAAAARGAGMSGLPFGIRILPTVEIDVLRAQNALLDMTDMTKIVPFNAGYRWQGDQLVGVPGTDGRFLDVATTMTRLQDGVTEVVDGGKLALKMDPVTPDILDPAPFLDQARALAAQPFQIIGYDPFRDERVVWSTDRDTFARWLEVGETGLTLREEAFVDFLDAQTRSLVAADEKRYLEPTDAMDRLRDAIATGQNTAYFRIRYRTTEYAVQRGDSGYRIARQLGVPFFLIEQANPGRDWDQMLVPGEMINLPSPDDVIPLTPVPTKRIVVDIDTQTLWAYENGELVFHWLVSTGMDRAPTSPGIYQVLTHASEATGSSIELCGDSSCGSWEMYWFMGIYEVYPGLLNGFHGAVLLPNNTYMGNGTVGRPFTYGCVMSQNDDAELLFHWAEQGTMVEIVSNEYAPRSALARRSLEIGPATAGPYIAPHIAQRYAEARFG